MLGRTTGAVLVGVDAHLVDVEVHLGGGLPIISAVGLPDPAVREGIDRIRAALPNAGFQVPARRIIVNLAPAEIRKQGAGLDLPIAVAILLADRQLRGLDTSRLMLTGELALDGTLRPVRGALSVALAAREAGKTILLVPRANRDEAALVEGLQVIGVSTLDDVRAFAKGLGPAGRAPSPTALLEQAADGTTGPDLCEVRGQASARRALEIAAAGGHHLLLRGPPGAGKTMLARRLPGILPPLAIDEALMVTRVWSAAGLAQGLVSRRPFRAPHHGVSFAGMTGGGPRLRPGEISLATHGVLYLDEMTEFRRDVLESLRQPLEDGRITLVRVHASAEFPADFTLVASMNPCPCGFAGSPDGRCDCTPLQVQRYQGKISGPLLDRFDLVVELPPVDLGALSRARPGEDSESVRRRVVATREEQRGRFGPEGPACNGRMTPRDLERHARLAARPRRLLLDACRRFAITARGFDRVRRVARTLADMDGKQSIEPRHVAEALQYRHPATSASG